MVPRWLQVSLMAVVRHQGLSLWISSTFLPCLFVFKLKSIRSSPAPAALVNNRDEPVPFIAGQFCLEESGSPAPAQIVQTLYLGDQQLYLLAAPIDRHRRWRDAPAG